MKAKVEVLVKFTYQTNSEDYYISDSDGNSRIVETKDEFTEEVRNEVKYGGLDIIHNISNDSEIMETKVEIIEE